MTDDLVLSFNNIRISGKTIGVCWAVAVTVAAENEMD
jgi:hypothetical protein